MTQVAAENDDSNLLTVLNLDGSALTGDVTNPSATLSQVADLSVPQNLVGFQTAALDQPAVGADRTANGDRLVRQPAGQRYPHEAEPNTVRYEGSDPQNWTSYTAYDSQGRFWRQVTRSGDSFNIRYDRSGLPFSQSGQHHYVPIRGYDANNDPFAPFSSMTIQPLQLPDLGAAGNNATAAIGDGLRAPREFLAQPDKPGVLQVSLDVLQTGAEAGLTVVGTAGEVARTLSPSSIVTRTLAGEEQIAYESLNEYQGLLQAIKDHGPDSAEAQRAADAYNTKTEALRAEGVFTVAERNASLVPAEITANIAEGILGAQMVSQLSRASRAAGGVSHAADLTRVTEGAGTVGDIVRSTDVVSDGAAIVNTVRNSLNRTGAAAGTPAGDVYHDIGMYRGRNPVDGLEGILTDGSISGATQKGAQVSQNAGPTNWTDSQITIRIRGTPDDFPNLGPDNQVAEGSRVNWFQTGSRDAEIDINGKAVEVIVNGTDSQDIARRLDETRQAVDRANAAREAAGRPRLDVSIVSISEFLEKERFPELAQSLPEIDRRAFLEGMKNSPLDAQKAIGAMTGKMTPAEFAELYETGWANTLDETRSLIGQAPPLGMGPDGLEAFNQALRNLSLAEQITLLETVRRPGGNASAIMDELDLGRNLNGLVANYARIY